MKTVTGRVISGEPISLSKAATILSGFVSSENEATQDVSAYLRRASAAFTELKNFHREIRSVKPKSEARHERNLTDELEEVSLAKGIDDLVENEEKIRSRGSETVTLEESIHGRGQDEVKEHKKKKKKKSKENKEEDVVEEKVNVKLEDEQINGESKNEKKNKKKKKSKKNKEEDVIDEKVNVKLEEEQRSEERKERKKEKKKRKSDGEICSEERKSKKKRKSKEIEG